MLRFLSSVTIALLFLSSWSDALSRKGPASDNNLRRLQGEPGHEGREGGMEGREGPEGEGPEGEGREGPEGEREGEGREIQQNQGPEQLGVQNYYVPKLVELSCL